MAIYFKEEYTCNKSGPFVSVNERMVVDYSNRVGSRHFYGVRGITVRMELLRTGKSRPKKSYASDANRTTVECQKSIMQRNGVTLVNPDGVSHLASECRVLR